MTPIRLTGLVLALITALATPAGGMEIYVHVQDETTTDPIEAAYVRYIFNPGTAVADTADGYTDIDGNVHLTHALVSGVPNTPSLAISRPYPNPSGSTATFEVSGDKAAESLSFALYDLRGRRVGGGEVGAGAIVLSRPLASGSYLYRVKEGADIRARGKLAVLGRLERVEFKAGAVSPSSKAGADAVDILVRANGYEDNIDSQVLADGIHFQTFALVSSRPPRIVFLESFSNTASLPSPELAENLEDMVAKSEFENGLVLYMEFHVSWPQITDPFYLANPQENSDRYIFYQLMMVPDLYVNGVQLADPLDAQAMEATVLNDLRSNPGFLVDVFADFSGESIPVTVILTPDRNIDLTGHTLYVAIYEEEIVMDPAPGLNGQTIFHHVFRDRADTPPEISTLTRGIPQQFDFVLNRGSGAPNNFVAVAFVQNNASRSIIQSGSTFVTQEFLPTISSNN